jgi:hypothetical protein
MSKKLNEKIAILRNGINQMGHLGLLIFTTKIKTRQIIFGV